MTFLKVFLYLAKIAFVILVIFVIFSRIEIKVIKEAISNANVLYIFLAFFFGFTTYVISSYKLKVSLSIIKDIPFSKILISRLKSRVYSIIPLGPDVGVILDLGSQINNQIDTAVLFLLDKFISVVSIALLIAVFLPFSMHLIPDKIRLLLFLFLLFIFIGTLITFLLSPIILKFLEFNEKIIYREKIIHLLKVLMFIRRNFHKYRMKFLYILVLGFILNFNIQISVYFLLRTIVDHVDLLYVITVIPINSFILLLPISILGIGVKEGGFYLLLSPRYNISIENIISFNIIGYSLDIFWIIFGSILLVLELFALRKK